jgi:hypothetical protein
MSAPDTVIQQLLDVLRQDLSGEREFRQQVIDAIADKYGTTLDQFEDFRQQKLPDMDEVDLDLLFSPLFTPLLPDKPRYMAVLGRHTLTGEQVSMLIQTLASENLQAELAATAHDKFILPVPEVMIERWVCRLSLDKSLPEGGSDIIERCVPADEQAWTNAIARDNVWQSSERSQLLVSYLEAVCHQQRYDREKLLALTDTVRTYRPSDLADLDQKLQSLIKSLEDDIPNVESRGFMDEELKRAYQAHGPNDANEAKHIRENYLRQIDLANQLREDIALMTSQPVAP